MCGVGEVIWSVTGNSRKGCGWGIKFCPLLVHPSVAQNCGEEPPLVLWGGGGRVGH